MADFTRPIPPVSPAEFAPVDYPAGSDAASARRRAAGAEGEPAAKRRKAAEADEPGEAEPEHQLDESA